MITSQQREQLHKQLIEEEGLILHNYKDQLGIETVGVGHNLEAKPLKGITFPLTKKQALIILDQDIDDVYHELIKKISFWDKLDAVRQVVLIDLAFNIGIYGLLKFKKTLYFLENENYKGAAMEMLDSKWATQVQKSRVNRLIHQMETGSY